MGAGPLFLYCRANPKGENILKKNIALSVRELIEPLVLSLGYVIWDVEYAKEGADWNLTVTIDNNDGIFIEDCEKVHRAIDPLLDEADLIEGAYRLNVSSPGIERELRTDFHIVSCIGDRVQVKLFAALAGKKTYTGVLTSYENGVMTLTGDDNSETKIDRTAASRIMTVFDWDSI